MLRCTHPTQRANSSDPRDILIGGARGLRERQEGAADARACKDSRREGRRDPPGTLQRSQA